MTSCPSHLPQGALRQRDGAVVWRAWAPHSDRVALVLWPAERRTEIAMSPAGAGYFEHREQQVDEGVRYAYRLDDGRDYPDPASRWQPDGVYQPSAVFLPETYSWSDSDWRGAAREDLVIYELHVGTFTAEGTFEAIVPRLAALAALGVTALELMPVGQFPGRRNWGYDGVHPYAAQNTYGGPRSLQRLVDVAHRAGLAVLLDVVYNHLGPEGNYLAQFGPYFTDRYRTPWGTAINFDGPHSDAVRQFFIDNACAWVRDFHVDGLRLDAVHAIYDFSPRHILTEIQEAVQEEASRQRRTVLVIAESNRNDVRLVEPPARGGYGLDALWTDDFHHSVHALLTGETDGYYQDFGQAAQLAKTYNDVFAYDGCYSPFFRRRQGTRAGGLNRAAFVICTQNHDQVGNRARGDRLAAILSPEARRLACGLLLLSPCTPLLLMGEEYGETRPFPYFCSFHDPGLVEAVRRGRQQEFPRDGSSLGADVPDPQEAATFESAVLSWAWPDGSWQARVRRLYRDLLTARRRWPPLRDRAHTHARTIEAPRSGAVRSPPVLFLLQRGAKDCLTAVANLSSAVQALPSLDLAGHEPIFSTEAACYGGSRDLASHPDRLYPYEMLVFGSRSWLA
jgi:maltooligosyltrehalose trehalohydrolase